MPVLGGFHVLGKQGTFYCRLFMSMMYLTYFLILLPRSAQADSTQSSKSVVVIEGISDQQNLFRNATMVTPFTTGGHSIKDENAELNTTAFSSDYEDYDYFDLSQVAPEVVLDLEPAELILSHEQNLPQEGRRLVPDGFVKEQERELLRLHNLYRSNTTPPAADMSFMEWNDQLARIAQDWANMCQFRHGFPPHSFPGAMGQNLYMGHDPTGVRALIMWFEEYQYYNMKTLECLPGEQCGHYTQMVWGESGLLGCGMKRCGVRRFYVVCHYSPPGNIIGQAPYIVGKPCSQCMEDHGGLCTTKLCVTREQCSRNREVCDPECPLKCHNCGVLNPATCKCNCADGWDSLDCSRQCTNAHENCGKNPGWPTITTCSMNQYAVANVYCRKMCGKCRGNENSVSADTCCEGAVCAHGYVLDQKNGCGCRLLCPGPLCDEEYEESGSQNPSRSLYLLLLVLTIQIACSIRPHDL